MSRLANRALLAAPLLLACGSGADDEAPRPSVVLVLVDQLRKDSADRWMPATRALAEDGVVLEEMRSAAPWTYPAVISLLSGLHPQQHNADGDESGKRLTVFAREVPLLPRLLGAAGYSTAGFVTNPFLHEWNPLHEAFDDYDASFIGNQGARRGHGEEVWTAAMYADSVNPAVRRHFDARAYTGPEFVYVHYMDVHGRKEGPERWKEAPFEPSYEAAVRSIDARIRELYDYFTARTGGELLFLVTSDHGQDLDDDLALGDGQPWRARKASLHDFNLRVPFWVLPGNDVPRALLRSPCSSVDVLPTLLEWLELPPSPSAVGQSLLGALRGEPYDGRARALYARNSAFGRFEEALLHDGAKFMRYRTPERVERRLFDLSADPREVNPLPDRIGAERLLDETVSASNRLLYPRVFEEAAPDLREDLDVLGYGGTAEDD